MPYSACSNSNYCLSNTGNPLWDDNFSIVSGTPYNDKSYFTGQTNGYYIYYSSAATQWCLSTSLGGTCLMFGPVSSVDDCPDLFVDYFSVGPCLTPTPTPTSNCLSLDFEAFFDCVVTPSVTPTLTPTPSNTPPLSGEIGYFQNACDASFIFAIYNIPLPEVPTVGTFCYVESSGFDGCVLTISATGVTEYYSYTSIIEQTGYTECVDTYGCPSPTPTPTPTITPTEGYTCSLLSVNSSITAYTPTPTVTPTITPTNSSPVVRPCNFSGDVTFITIDGYLEYPSSKQYQDCENGFMYYTANVITGSPQQFEIYIANVDGQVKCISYVGLNESNFGVNDITILSGPIGFSNLGDCSLCSITPTPTTTPTLTPTPTPSPVVCFCYELIAGELTEFFYVDCDGVSSTATTSAFTPVYVCSRVPVTTNSTGIYAINMRGQCTLSPFAPPACPTINCTCYSITNGTANNCMIVYYDCNDDIQFTSVAPYSDSINFCSKIVPYINKLDKTNITINTFNACVAGVCV